jgi:hydroxymethylbilane synthase
VAALLRRLEGAPSVEIEILRVSGGEEGTGGSGVPADKRRWVDAIEQGLLEERIDLAVHSAKDLPGELAPGLELIGATTRESPEDVICGAFGVAELPAGARVGTSSLRRTAQLRAARPDLCVQELNGNVDTRLRRLTAGELEAIVLARAGLRRLGREASMQAVLDPRRFVPAPGQGTLALEGRAQDERPRAAAAAISDDQAMACLLAERTLSWELGADCHTPLGAHAAPAGTGTLELRAWVGLPDGSEWIVDELSGAAARPRELGQAAADRLRAAGAGELLRRAAEMAAPERA